MKKCTACRKQFEEKHFNQRCCSESCKIDARRQTRKRYKQSDKGKLSNQRWVNSERRKENEKRYMQQPRQKRLAVLRVKRYIQKHPELKYKKREQDKRYSKTENGKKARSKAVKKYRMSDRGIQVHRNNKSRRRQVEKKGSVSFQDWQEILQKHNNECAMCGRKIKLEQDHIIPLIKGGKHEKENIQPLCRKCNASKGSKIMG